MSRPTEADLQWLAKHHSSLLVFRESDKTLLVGLLKFSRSYKEVTRTDAYSIEIVIPDAADQPPKAYEKAGRLRKVMEKYGLKELADLHCYRSGRLCVAAPQELTLTFLPNPSLAVFFESYLVPFFYSQSYYEEYGKWLWPHLPHNAQGLLEWFNENSTLVGAASETIKELHKLDGNGAQRVLARGSRPDSFNPRATCLCGGARPYIECHPRLIRLALAMRSSSPKRTSSLRRKKRPKRKHKRK